VEVNARFNEALMSTYQHLASVLQSLCLPSNIPMVDESMEKIVSWESLFESFVTNLSLDTLCEDLFKVVSSGVSFSLCMFFSTLCCCIISLTIPLLCRRC